MKININDATLATLNGEPIFSEKTSAASYSEINVKGSELIATAYGAEDYELAYLIGNRSVTAKAYIEKSTVTGLTYAPNIIYGADNVFNFVGDLNSDFVLANGVKVAFSNKGASMQTVELAVPGYAEPV